MNQRLLPLCNINFMVDHDSKYLSVVASHMNYLSLLQQAGGRVGEVKSLVLITL